MELPSLILTVQNDIELNLGTSITKLVRLFKRIENDFLGSAGLISISLYFFQFSVCVKVERVLEKISVLLFLNKNVSCIQLQNLVVLNTIIRKNDPAHVYDHDCK